MTTHLELTRVPPQKKWCGARSFSLRSAIQGYSPTCRQCHLVSMVTMFGDNITHICIFSTNNSCHPHATFYASMIIVYCVVGFPPKKCSTYFYIILEEGGTFLMSIPVFYFYEM